VIFYGVHGDLRPFEALLLGLPAAGGAVVGAAVQQRLANRTLTLAFSALLFGVGIRLFV